jgi:hypothetical protein
MVSEYFRLTRYTASDAMNGCAVGRRGEALSQVRAQELHVIET